MLSTPFDAGTALIKSTNRGIYMRKAIAIVLLIVLGTMPLQTSAQVSVPAVELHCDNSYQDNTSGPTEPMGYIDTSESNNNTTIFSPIECYVSNPNSYVERIQIQMNANGLSLSANGSEEYQGGNITLAPNGEDSFNISAIGEVGMPPGVVILNVTATVVEANGAPPPNTAQSYIEGEIWIINDEYEEPTVPDPVYCPPPYYTPEMIHAANNWRYVDLETQYTTQQGELVNNGSIRIQLNHSAAPLHSESFALLALMGCYDNVIFHRVISGFMIQGGDFVNQAGTGGYAAKWYGYCNGENTSSEGVEYTEEDCSFESWTIPDEANNGLSHIPGALSMAKTNAPHTGGSQFFIIPSDSTPSHLDGVHTVFGTVTDGLDNVDSISSVDTGQNDRPVNDVTIVSIEITNDGIVSTTPWYQFW